MAEYANSQLNLLEAIRGLTLTAERCPKVPGMRVTLVQPGAPDCGLLARMGPTSGRR